MKVKINTIVRTILLFVTLINMILVHTGKAPLELDENVVYQMVSDMSVMIMSVVTWWKNNSFTKAALMGDEVCKGIKCGKVEVKEITVEKEKN